MVIDALHQALRTRRLAGASWERGGLIHHSDAGSQYVSVALTAELIEAGIAGSIGTVGDALDNALCESTIGLFKTEAGGGNSWRDRRDVEWRVASWAHWYNTIRLHSSIGHLPPVEYEHHHRQAKTATPTVGVAQSTHPPRDSGRFILADTPNNPRSRSVTNGAVSSLPAGQAVSRRWTPAAPVLLGRHHA